MQKRSYVTGLVFALCTFAYIVVYTFMNLFVDFDFVTLTPGSLFIALVPFGVWTLAHIWYYKSRNSVGMSKAFVINCIIIGAIICSYTIYLLAQNERDSYFNYNRWVSEPGERIQMVDHLLDRYQLEGRTEQQMEELLGRTAESPSFVQDEVVYYLGGYGFGVAYLVVTYKDGQVVSHEIRTD